MAERPLLAAFDVGVFLLELLDAASGVDQAHLSGEEGVMLLGAWQQGVYHSPADDLQQFINWEAAAQHVAFLEGFTRYVADNPLRPAWHLDGPYAQFSLQTTSP